MACLSEKHIFKLVWPYDETYGVIYGVIYEVIMRKFRASMEPFCDSKFSEYVEYLARVSSENLTSSVLPSLTSSDG